MSKNEIFILMDCTEYEGCDAIVAFESIESAEKMKLAAEEYDAIRPDCPDMDADNEIWDSYGEILKVWKKSHPLGPNAERADTYLIAKIPFIGDGGHGE